MRKLPSRGSRPGEEKEGQPYKAKQSKGKKRDAGREMPLPLGRIFPNSDQQLAPETGPFHWPQRQNLVSRGWQWQKGPVF